MHFVKIINKKIRLFFLLTLSIFLISSLVGAKAEINQKDTPKQDLLKVTLNKKSFQVEIADSFLEKQKGLMFRKDLCSSCGMLFVFSNEKKREFWMKNTLIPLDIVFISKQKKVVDKTTLKPCLEETCPSYESKQPAQYVLEVNAGTFTNVLHKKVHFSMKQDSTR